MGAERSVESKFNIFAEREREREMLVWDCDREVGSEGKEMN